MNEKRTKILLMNAIDLLKDSHQFENHEEFENYCYKELGMSKDELAEMNNNFEEINQNYKIISKTMTSEREGIVLGYNEKAPAPYVTWEFYQDSYNNEHYTSGHYFCDKKTAQQDMIKRTATLMDIDLEGFYKERFVEEIIRNSLNEYMHIDECKFLMKNENFKTDSFDIFSEWFNDKVFYQYDDTLIKDLKALYDKYINDGIILSPALDKFLRDKNAIIHTKDKKQYEGVLFPSEDRTNIYLESNNSKWEKVYLKDIDTIQSNGLTVYNCKAAEPQKLYTLTQTMLLKNSGDEITQKLHGVDLNELKEKANALIKEKCKLSDLTSEFDWEMEIEDDNGEYVDHDEIDGKITASGEISFYENLDKTISRSHEKSKLSLNKDLNDIELNTLLDSLDDI